jgi:hypothetical protein
MMKNFIISCFLLLAVVTLLHGVEAKPANRCRSYAYTSTCTRYGFRYQYKRACIKMGRCSSWKVRSSRFRCVQYINRYKHYRQCVKYIPYVNTLYCAARHACYQYGNKRFLTYGCLINKRSRICRRWQIYRLRKVCRYVYIYKKVCAYLRLCVRKQYCPRRYRSSSKSFCRYVVARKRCLHRCKNIKVGSKTVSRYCFKYCYTIWRKVCGRTRRGYYYFCYYRRSCVTLRKCKRMRYLLRYC